MQYNLQDQQVKSAIMAHTQLAFEQRYQIKALIQAKHSRAKIATIVGVVQSTIYRELKGNTGRNLYPYILFNPISKHFDKGVTTNN